MFALQSPSRRNWSQPPPCSWPLCRDRDAGRVDVVRLPATAWWALAYLVVASTSVGYAVFLAVNADVPPTLANTFKYAGPTVALLLSVALLVRGSGARR